MKYLITIFLALITNLNYAQNCKKIYKEQLEPDSKIISCEYNATIEKLKDGTCILKRYYPENNTITHRLTFKSDKFKIKHGLYEERWDNGKLVTSGMYSNNQKQGEWRNNTNEIGTYNDDLKEGIWLHYRADKTVYAEQQYLNGQLHGEQIYYDTSGAVAYKEVYQYGLKTNANNDSISLVPEELPRFAGCEELGLSTDDLKTCADKKMMQFVYSNLKYPMKARETGVQGKALIRFVVDKSGNVTDINVLNGVSKEIKKEVIRLVNTMPKWIPGKKDGQAVNVQYSLPIMFRLE